MSRTVVGYEGEGKHRRPVYDSPPVEELGFNPPGAIERRQAAEHERAGFAPGRPSAGLHRAAPRPALALVPPAEPRRSVAVTELVEAAIHPEHFGDVDLWRQPIAVTPEPVTPQEEPAMAIEPPPVEKGRSEHSKLQAVADAAADAAVARAVLDGALQAVRAADAALAEAEVAWDQARDALEASWRATGIGFAVGPDARPNGANVITGIIPDAPAPDFAGAAAALGVTEAEARRLNEPDAIRPIVPFAPPAVGTNSAGGGPEVKLARGQREVLEAVLRHDGDRRKAAEELHRSVATVETQLDYVGRKGLLPAELIAKLPARFAKYSPAAG